MKTEYNIIILGVDYYGRMATSQRIRNMVDGLLLIEPMQFVDVVFFDGDRDHFENPSVKRVAIPLRLKNMGSVVGFFRKNYALLKEVFDPNKRNVLYCMGYPSIENIMILRRAKKLGYTILFDIVEKADAYDLTKASWKIKLQSYTKRKLLGQIPALGSACFGISYALVDYCKKICGDRISVALLPISVNVDQVHSFKRIEKAQTDRVRIFYGGSFGYKDGITLLIEAFSKAAETNPHIELVLTGVVCKQMKDELPRLLDNSSAKDRIHFLGCLPTEKYYEVMANSDILCMLRVGSDFANAGFPFKLGEYLASGNAILATRTTDISKYLKHKEDAYLISPDSVDEIKSAILELAQNPELRKRLSDNSKNIAENCFAAKKVSGIVYDFLENIR